MISHKYKFVCPKIGKNASSALVKYFSKIDPNLINEGHLSIMGGGFYYFLKGGYFAGKNHNEYFKFAFVRNPYDRLVSAFYEFKRPDMFGDMKQAINKDSDFKLDEVLSDFSEFFRMTKKYDHIHWKLQHSMIHHGPKILVEYIGRVETLQEDIDKICERVGIDNSRITIPVARKSEGKKHYLEYYTDELKEQVYEKYKLDFEFFGYNR